MEVEPLALTQMQIIQSLGEAMSWFERELNWGVQPTELRHLSGRVGELYAALIHNGQMAQETNQKGYDVVGGNGERISVKTTAIMGSSGHIAFNPNTLDLVDRVMILRINTEEMQIETLHDERIEYTKQLMSKPTASGKVNIALSKLTKSIQENGKIAIVKVVSCFGYDITELENGSILVDKDGELITPVKPVLREIASKINVPIINANGNLQNTRQLGSLIIKTISEQ